jgi:voltage-gated potassium channel Kch
MTFRTEGPILIADLAGDVTGERGLELNRHLSAALSKLGPAAQVLINLDQCRRLDAVALRVFAKTCEVLVHHRHGSFGLVKVGASIRESLVRAALLYRFELFDDEVDAIRQLSNRRAAFARLTGHTIVCGYGRVGSHVAAELRQAGVPCVVIDTDPTKVALARDLDCPAVEGDCSSEDILKQAGADSAHRLVAALSSDDENMVVVFTARTLNPDLVIVARANEDDSAAQLSEAGASDVVSLYKIGAHQIVTTLLGVDD